MGRRLALVRLPAILPHSSEVYGMLRPLHGALAYLLFLTVLTHLGAARRGVWPDGQRGAEVDARMARLTVSLRWPAA